MAKKIQLQDANGNVLHPLTLGECVTMSNGENLDTLMSKSQMFTPTITQDKSMFKVGTGVDVDYSANVKDGAYEGLVFKGKSLVNLMTSCKDETLIQYYNPPADSNVANVSMIKPNTVYTIIYSVKYREEGNTGHLIVRTQQDGGDINVSSGFTFGTTYKRFAYKFTTPSTIDYFVLRSNGHYFHVKEVMLLEGDYTNVDLPYFEGLCDSKMPILRTTGKNWLYYGETLGTPSITSYSLSNNELTITNDGTKSYQQINFVYKDLLNYKGKTLTLSGYATPNKADLKPCFQVVFQDSSGKTYYYGSTNSANTTKRMSRTFTIPYDISSDYTPRISFIVHNANESGYSGTAVFSEIMLEESPSPTTYENHKTNILRTSEEIVLREVDGVCDTYNSLTGEYIRRIGEIVVDGETLIGTPAIYENTVRFAHPHTQMVEKAKPGALAIANNMIFMKDNNEDIPHFRFDYSTYGSPTFWVDKSKLETVDSNGVRKYLTQNPVTIQYELAEPVATIIKPSTMTPFAYQNGHVIVESGFEGQSLLPEIEYSVVTGRTGQVTQNNKVLRKQEQQIIGLEELLLTQVVQMEYERTLLQFDYELQMMMLG